MPDYLCHACGRKVHVIYECGQCGRILCENCRGAATYCKDSRSGTAGCNGYLKRRQ